MKLISVSVCMVFCLGVSALTYLDYAHILADEGIINTREQDSKYRVNDFVWRQEVIGMAVKMNENILLEQYACAGVFNDVTIITPNTWICAAAEAAADHGIITRWEKYPLERRGVKPERNITRSEALAIVWDALDIERADEELVEKYTFSSDTVYWQKILLSAAKERGIIADTYTFGPNEDATRWEIFEMVAKLKGFVPSDTAVMDAEMQRLLSEFSDILDSLQ